MKKFFLSIDMDVILTSVVSVGTLVPIVLTVIAIYCK